MPDNRDILAQAESASNSLKPCPFCGGKPKWIIGGPGCAFVSCTECPAETGDGSVPRIGAAWNTRAPVKVKPLMWHNFDAWTWWAESIAGTYHVFERGGNWITELRFRDAIHTVYEIDGFETAIVAAQADHERRIREALE